MATGPRPIRSSAIAARAAGNATSTALRCARRRKPISEVPASPARPIPSSTSESVVHVEGGDDFEERPQVGGQRELPHEEQRHRRHAEREDAVGKQAERAPAETVPPPRHPGQDEGLPDERGDADRDHDEEGAAPADQAAEKAAQRRGDDGGERGSALQHGQRLGHVGPATMRATMAVDSDQKPPTDTPISARPIMKMR